MLLKIIGSSSSGNSTFLKLGSKFFLIDCGFSKKKINDELNEYNLTIDDINYLFLTHEHIDHISGLKYFLSMKNLNIVLTDGTYNYIVDKYDDDFLCNFIFIKKKDDFYYENLIIDDIEVNFLRLFHDALEPVGFVFNYQGKKISYLTDTGYVHEKNTIYMLNSDLYIMECNYDPKMLMDSQRPIHLIQRILSHNGHLSNEDSLYFLSKVVGDKTKYVYYSHISKDCNLVNIIEMTKDSIFQDKFQNIKFIAALPYKNKGLEL